MERAREGGDALRRADAAPHIGRLTELRCAGVEAGTNAPGRRARAGRPVGDRLLHRLIDFLARDRDRRREPDGAAGRRP
jgi:hypothetical protein